jgi:hypothetical protein
MFTGENGEKGEDWKLPVLRIPEIGLSVSSVTT